MTDAAAPAAAGPGPHAVRVWDLGVRVFHWSLATLFLLNFAVLDEESKLHEWVGYGVVALVALRLVWGVVGTRYARFSAFPPSLSAARRHAMALIRGEREEPALSHNPLGALMVYNLFACMLLLGLTGWMMTLDAFWGVGWLEELHEIVANWAFASVVMHVAGVAVESWRSRVPLVRAMLTGWKELPPQSRPARRRAG
jgi:cytochrome b